MSQRKTAFLQMLRYLRAALLSLLSVVDGKRRILRVRRPNRHRRPTLVIAEE